MPISAARPPSTEALRRTLTGTRIPLLYLLFLLSGAAGLTYEVVWARYLSLFVGHEAYAQALVLAIFLGGLALGALLVARRADAIANPLRAYAGVEAAVGLLGLGFHAAFVASTEWALGHGMPALGGAGAAALKWGLAAGLILPQSVLLGATFPLMSAGVLRLAPAAPGRILGWLYFTNSLGAAIGALVAGFTLIAWFGLPGVMVAAGGLNLVVAGASLWLSRGQRRAPLPAAAGAPPPAEPVGPSDAPGAPPATAPPEAVLLAAAFLTAVASFAYEIDWIRMLSLVLGSATHAFELMLSAFILGLALGAFWIRSRADRFRDPLRALAGIQIVMGVLAVATLPVYMASFAWMDWLHDALAPTGAGYTLYTLARYALCLAVMLPATFCAGATLPLITRILVAGQRSEAAIGRVYGANTLGAIAGVVLAALVLMPVLGLRGLLVAAGLLDVAVGAMILAAAPGPEHALRRVGWPLAAAVAVLVALAHGVDRLRLVSGVYRGAALETAERLHLDYYADGRTATVAVTRAAGGHLALSTNGKVDASLSEASQQRCDPLSPPRQIDGDEVTQLLLGLVPLAFVADGAETAVIGMGAGVTTHTLLASPRIARVTTIEIEPRMVDGARLFSPANRRAFEDPRSRIAIGDARTVLSTGPDRLDLVVSEPSNPWVSGVASLFTVEFYRRVASRLTARGLLAQWLQTYDLDDVSILRVLGAIEAVFPDWRVYQVGEGDVMILATPAGALPAPDWGAVAALPALRDDLCGVVPLEAATLEATLLADRALLREAAIRVGAPNSDFHPRLDLVAERRRFESRSAASILALGDDWLNHARQLMGRPAPPVPVWRTTFAGIRRPAAQVARTWQDAAPDSVATPELGRVRHEWWRWQHGLGETDPPPDWRAWVRELEAVGRVRRGGAAGVADSGFYAAAMDFARRHDAPPMVLDVLRFRRASQEWRALEALAAAERLVLVPGGPQAWIAPRDLVDGAVVSALALGRAETARVWLEQYGRLTDRGPDDLVSRIVAGLVAAASDSMPSP